MIRKANTRSTRHARIRAKISGTSLRPRLFVFRSNQHIYAQLIDDSKGVTILSATEKEISKAFLRISEGSPRERKLDSANKEIKKSKTKVEKALLIGELVAKKALEKNIKEVVFDRGGYIYHGRVKSVAEGARKGGLIF